MEKIATKETPTTTLLNIKNPDLLVPSNQKNLEIWSPSSSKISSTSGTTKRVPIEGRTITIDTRMKIETIGTKIADTTRIDTTKIGEEAAQNPTRAGKAAIVWDLIAEVAKSTFTINTSTKSTKQSTRENKKLCGGLRAHGRAGLSLRSGGRRTTCREWIDKY